MKLRVQWLAVAAFAMLSSILPPSMRSTCVTLANGAWLAQRVVAIAQVLDRYASAQPPVWRRT